MNRKRTSIFQLLGYFFLGIVLIIIAIFDFIKEHYVIFIGIGVVIVGIIFFPFAKKNRKKPELLNTEISGERKGGFFEKVREAVKSIDILPKIEINEDEQKEVSAIISFVYADGSVSSPGMPQRNTNIIFYARSIPG